MMQQQVFLTIQVIKTMALHSHLSFLLTIVFIGCNTHNLRASGGTGRLGLKVKPLHIFSIGRTWSGSVTKDADQKSGLYSRSRVPPRLVATALGK